MVAVGQVERLPGIFRERALEILSRAEERISEATSRAERCDSREVISMFELGESLAELRGTLERARAEGFISEEDLGRISAKLSESHRQAAERVAESLGACMKRLRGA